MSFGYSYRYDSYNSLTVPLDIGTWECTLLRRGEYDQQTSWLRSSRERGASDPWHNRSSGHSSSWFDRDDDPDITDRKRREDDESTFLQYFRPNYDLGSITGQAALREIRSFLSDWLKVAYWNLPTDNAGIERALKQAVEDGTLVPVVDRDHRNTQRTFRPTPAPLYWPQSGGGSVPVRVWDYGPSSALASGEPVLSGPYDPVSRAASADDDSGGFDWLGVAEAVAGAVLGGANSAEAGDDGGMVDSFTDTGDTSTPLGDAQPFELGDGAGSGDVMDIAARGVSEEQEAECHALLELDLEKCEVARAMYQDPRTYALCKQNAFANYQSCRGY